MGKKSKSAKKSKAEQPAKSAAELETAATAAPAEPATKMSSKEYYKELEKLEAELVHLQSWVIRKGLKVVILVFEGRDGAGKGGTIKAITGARQPARFPRRRAADADRAREDADVHPALPAALAGGRRSGHLRPQLVQPRRRRAGDGLCHRRAGAAFPANDADVREG
jgi:hypothetical protein